jgi:hypothetical protein
MNRYIKELAIYGIAGFITPIVLTVAIFWWRLYLSGFSQRDLEDDVATFPRRVLPFAATCAIVMCTAKMTTRHSRNVPHLIVVLMVAGGALAASALCGTLNPVGLDGALRRGAVAFIGACAVYAGFRIFNLFKRRI